MPMEGYEIPKNSFPRARHSAPRGVLIGRGVKTLAQLKAGNQSVTS
jgi:hypothetical protein